jgi:hypothetical protein
MGETPKVFKTYQLYIQGNSFSNIFARVRYKKRAFKEEQNIMLWH